MNKIRNESRCRSARIVFAPKFSEKQLKIISNSNNKVLLLVENSESRDKWIDRIGTHQLTDIKSEIENSARRFEKQFNKQISDHLFQYGKFSAVLLRVYERNTLVSNFFQDCVFVITGIKFIKGMKNLTILTDKIAVAYDLSQIANIQVEGNNRLRRIKRYLLIQIYIDLRNMLNIFKWFYGNQIAAFGLKSAQTNLIIHSFADQNTLNDRRYKERYFPELFENLKINGKNPSMLISNSGFFPRLLWKHLIESGLNPCLEFKYIRMRDLVKLLRELKSLSKVQNFEFRSSGNTFNNVFHQNLRNSRFDLGTFQALTRKITLGNMVSHRNSEEKLTFICEYEGMQFEKAALIVRNNFPSKMKVIGIQHGSIFDNLLCTFPTKWDISSSMLPNKIVCNGSKFLELLKERNIDSKILVVGPALRYKFLHELSQLVPKKKGQGIFVPLPLTKNQETKTLRMIEEALGSTDIKVILKLHPFSDSHKNLEDYVNRNSNFEMVNSDFNEILKDISIVVSQTTGALLEFVLLGIPVIRISNPYEIEFNSVNSFKFGVTSIDNSEDLKNTIIETMKRQNGRIKAKKELNTYFNPQSNIDFNIFIS